MNITEEEYDDLKRTEACLNWLQQRGMCWRGVDNLRRDWRVGDETEWHYRNAGDVRELIEEHQQLLRPNDCGQPRAKRVGL